jgi:hypothetical protein
MSESGVSSADVAGVHKNYTCPEKVEIRLFALKGDLTPRLTFSLVHYLRHFSLWQLVLLEFLTSRILFLATSTLHKDDIGWR